MTRTFLADNTSIIHTTVTLQITTSCTLKQRRTLCGFLRDLRMKLGLSSGPIHIVVVHQKTWSRVTRLVVVHHTTKSIFMPQWMIRQDTMHYSYTPMLFTKIHGQGLHASK